MLRIVRGARLDRLLDAMLASMAERPLAPPMQEIVVIQGRGLDRWISQQAALRHGGWGFVETLFPRPFLMRAFAALLDGGAPSVLPDDGVMGVELQLRVAALLPTLCEQPLFASVAAAVRRADAQPVAWNEAALAIAPSIAEVLDRCAQHRVDQVVGWMKGVALTGKPADEAWLAELWRMVAAQAAPSRLIVDRERFLRACAEGQGPPPGLPGRVSIFGVSTLAPAFLELIEALGRRMEVTVFALEPCPGEGVHALVRHWGTESFEFAEMVDERVRAGGVAVAPDEVVPPAPERAGSLATLHARLRGEITEPGAPQEVDDTLTLRSCAGMLDEVEVVHDCITALLRNDATLEPRDFAILTPSLQDYGPIVEAVFGSRRDERDRVIVPFAVADRDRGTAFVVDAFARVLELALSRCERGSVLESLALGPISGAFDLGGSDLEILEQWCDAAQIRWGLDAEHRAVHDRPSETIGTWQWGIDRLHLGAAAADGTTGALGVNEPVAPVFAAEGSGVDRVLALQSFLDALRPLAMSAGAARPLVVDPAQRSAEAEGERALALTDGDDAREDWLSLIETLATRVLAGDADHEAGATVVHAKLAALRAAALASGFHGAQHAIGVRAAVTFVVEQLRDAHPGRGLLASGVTVASLQPMRSIPFRVIVLVGMAEGAIPRASSSASFDLVAAAPRRGDRTPRLDDRQVMLETIFAASRALVITWPGVDPASGRDTPASVLVDELREVMRDLIGAEPSVRTSREIAEPSDRTSRDSVAAPTTARAVTATPGVAIDASTDAESIATARSVHAMTLDALERFWRSPAEGHLRALGVGVDWRASETACEDPIGNEFDRVILRAMMPLGFEQSGDALQIVEAPTAVIAGSGWLPRGPAATRVVREAHAMLAEWVDGVAEIALRAGATPDLRGALTMHEVDIEVTVDPRRALIPVDPRGTSGGNAASAPVRLTGRVPAMRGVGPLIMVESELDHATVQLRTWIRLLAMRASSDAPVHALVFARKAKGRGDERAMKPEARLVAAPSAEQARAFLADLLAIALRGRREPIAFMPCTSIAYAHHCEKSSPEPMHALEQARSVFAAARGDRHDVSVRTLFGPDRFFDARSSDDPSSFVSLAERIARPLNRAWKDGLSTSRIGKPAKGARSASAPVQSEDDASPAPRRRRKST